MIRFAADENFNNKILHGVSRQNRDIEIVRVQDSSVSGADDPEVLDWAARDGRVLLTHDANTMTKYAYQRINSGLPMPGLCVVRQSLPIRSVVDDLLLLAECSDPDEWWGLVRYLPVR